MITRPERVKNLAPGGWGTKAYYAVKLTGDEWGVILVITDADIDDCLFRMLQWPELLAAQQMHRMPDGSDYQLTARRKNKRGQFVELSNELRVKMIGNAVSAPVATMLGEAIAVSLMAA